MKKKRTVAVMTIILVTAFALSSIGIGFLPDKKQEDRTVIWNDSQPALTANQLKEYVSILSGPDRQNFLEAKMFLIDYKVYVESLKNLGYRAPTLLASQLYNSTFGNSDLNTVLSRLRISRNTLEMFFLDQALTASVEAFFSDASFLDQWVDQLLSHLLVRFSGSLLFFRPGDIPVSKPTLDEMEEYYEMNLQKFKEPEKASGFIGYVNLDQVYQKLPYKQEDLEEFYLKNKSRFKEDDKIECENYLFSEKDFETVKILNRSNFNEFQNDLSRLNLTPTLLQRVYSETEFKNLFNAPAQVEALVGPAAIANGVAVCRVKSIQTGRQLGIDEAKDTLMVEFFLAETASLLRDLSAEMRNRDQMTQFLTDYGLESAEQFMNKTSEELTLLSKNKAAMRPGVYFFQDNGSVKFVAVTEVTPERVKTFQEVQSMVESEIILAKQSKELDQSLRAFANDPQLKENPLNWRQVLGGIRFSETPINDETVADRFMLFEAKPYPGVYGPFFEDEGATLLIVTNVKPHSGQIPSSETVQSIREALRRSLNLLPLKELTLPVRPKINVDSKILGELGD